MATEDNKKHVAAALKARLVLEQKLNKKITALFRVYASDVYQTYQQFGLPYLSTDFKDKLTGVLRDHYTEVTKTLAGFNSRYIDTDLDESEILAYVVDHTAIPMNNRAVESADSIINTTNEELRNFVGKITEAAGAENRQVSRQEMGRYLQDNIVRRAKHRADAIAVTETTWSAETVSESEIIAILDDEFQSDIERALGGDATQDEIDAARRMGFEAAYAAGLIEARKVWNAIIDDRTRPAHLEASGQTVRAGEPFIVGGEALMYPGLGSIGNSIHCRCVVTYTF